MEQHEVAIMSSKGQIVIPQELRKKMNLREGSKFAVVGIQDAIILRKLEPPKWEDFDNAISRLRSYGRESGIDEKRVGKAVRDLRRRG